MENEFHNQESHQESQRFDTMGPVQYQTQHTPSRDPKGGKKKHKALAIASLVLSGLSLCCCWLYVVGIIPAVIGGIFGLIALVGGKDKSVKIMGGIGMGLGIIGVGLSLIMLISYISIINWDNMTMEKFSTFRYVDPDDRQEVMRWIQQFFKEDISSSMYY